ncbi:MAG: hypothetical protein AAFU65_09155 [Pseudomonadota bacterium]
MKATILTLILGLTSAAYAQVPSKFDYQGYLADASGAPLDDTASMTFVLYNVPNGGAALWATAQDVPVSQGLFTVELGGDDAALPPQIFDGHLYLEVTVNGETLQPRRQLQAAPFALKARDADTIGGLTAEDLDLSDEIAQFQSVMGEIKTLPSDWVDPVPPTGNQTQFIGDTVEFTIAQDQRLFITLTAALGLPQQNATARVTFGLCAQSIAGGDIFGVVMTVADLDNRRQSVSVSGGTGPVNAGTWRFGPCVSNDSSHTISNNGLVSGWIVKAN